MRTRSLTERIIHAVFYEIVAIFTLSPIVALVMNKPFFQMGTLAVLLATIAMIWNMIYNAVFDRFYPPGAPRSPRVRVLHGLGFEGGFILIGVPPAALMLNISLLQAFMLDIVFFLLFLPYTIIYNWVYDRIRAHIITKMQSGQ